MQIVNGVLVRALAASSLLLICTTMVRADQDDPPPTNRYVQASEAIESASGNVTLDEILHKGRRNPADRDRLPMERPRGSDLKVLKDQDCGCQ